MKYEIINPSDMCFIESEDELIAITACLTIGNGAYGLKNSSGETVCPILSFGGADEFLEKKFGGAASYQKYFDENLLKIAVTLETFSYPSERTSLNNIGERAKMLAVKFREYDTRTRVAK